MTSTIDTAMPEELQNKSIGTEDNLGEAGPDAGRLSSHNSQAGASAIDYWYGKRYFEDIIAQEVFLSCTENEPVVTVEARFQDVLKRFPYHEAIKSLQRENATLNQSTHLPTSSDAQHEFPTLIGTSIRQGSAQERKQLLNVLQETIQQFSGLKNSNMPQALGVQHPSPSPLGGDRVSPPGNKAEIKDSIYTSILKERADMRNLPLEYTYDRSPHDPETFKAQLKFNGRVFHGVGRKKQEAKHQASKEACSFLDSQREQLS